jgi:hypothetical protein
MNRPVEDGMEFGEGNMGKENFRRYIFKWGTLR